ncbi:MAG TPA: DUF3090 family protein [Galbitalea sp.]|jgi:uncharacterized repeat protein (TIGR03847 family)
MAAIVYRYDWPDRVVVGTIGPPGSRAFYLQARLGPRVTSVLIEKEQSALLAAKIDEILDALMTTDGNPSSVPATSPPELVDAEPLDQPVEPEFRTGAIGLGWDPTTTQIVIEAYPIDEGDESDADSDSDALEPREIFEIRMPVGTARAFAKRTFDIVRAGRGTTG